MNVDSCFEKDISYWYYDISSIADMDSDGCNAACRAIDYCAAAVFVTSNKRCYPKVVAVTATWARRVEVGTNTEHIWCSEYYKRIDFVIVDCATVSKQRDERYGALKRDIW